MSLPTSGETFAVLIEHLRKAQETAAMLGHLKADEDKHLSHGWLGISELLRRMVHQVTELATKGRILQ
jgi:hypothetical protein